MNKGRSILLWMSLPIAALILAACGGGGGQTAGGGTGGTGMVAVSRGPITSTATATAVVAGATTTRAAKTTITVNGVTYQTVGATLDLPDGMSTDVDGSAGGTTLFTGMVVTVRGTINAGGLTGSATTITYVRSVNGQVSNVVAGATAGTATFSVYGQSVSVDLATTLFEALGGTGITAGGTIPTWLQAAPAPWVEVSGFVQPNGLVVATYVKEVAAQSDVELEGIVTSVSAPTSFMLGGTTILVPSSIALDWTTLANQQVKVTAQLPVSAAETQLTATDVQVESSVPGAQEGDVLELTDVVSSVDAAHSTFQIGAQRVTYDATTTFKNGTAANIVIGVQLEAEGPLVNGTIQATEVHFQ